VDHILVVEDDRPVADFIRRGLTHTGYSVAVRESGPDALQAAGQRPFDLVLLDLTLPGMDGIDVCRALRERSEVPLIMLTARDTTEAKIEGLEAGADDYLVKPFAFGELVARIRAALRRRQHPRVTALRIGDLTIDHSAHMVWRGGRQVALTAREFDLLEFLARNAGQYLPRGTIEEEVWGYEHFSATDPVKVYVSYLRRKLNAAGEPDLIRSRRGVGYMLES
jgi:two-component system response regulator MprA